MSCLLLSQLSSLLLLINIIITFVITVSSIVRFYGYYCHHCYQYHCHHCYYHFPFVIVMLPMLCILLSLQLVLPIITIMIFGDTITFLSCYFFLYFPSLFFHAFFRFSLPSFHFPCSSTQKQTQTSLTRSHCLRSNTKRKGWVAWASQRQRTAIKYSECWPTLENNYHYDDGPSAWNLPALASNSALFLPTEFLFRVICCDPLILFLCCYFFPFTCSYLLFSFISVYLFFNVDIC